MSEKRVTISTHNGSAAHREHNVRNEKVVSKESHIDLNRVHEIWKDERVQDAYKRIFGNAVKEYNKNQLREDRKIKDYYKSICEDKKKHPVYEMIIGVYGQDENGAVVCDEKTGKQIMKEFVEKWQERNPNLELIGAYYHADEQGEPHCHIDYIPVAHGYSRGMETQTGLVKALEEMGFKKQGKATAQIQWQARENKALEEICNKYGLEVDHPKERGRQHIETAIYKAEKRKERVLEDTKELLDQQDVIRGEISELESVNDDLRTENEALNKRLDKKLQNLKDIAAIKKPGLFKKGDTVEIHVNTYEALKEQIKEVRDDREYADMTVRNVAKREKRVKAQEDLIQPLYNKANNEYEHARAIREAEEENITKKAKKLLKERLSVTEIDKESERMKEYMSNFQVNGKPMTEAYEEYREKQIEKETERLMQQYEERSHSRGMSR